MSSAKAWSVFLLALLWLPGLAGAEEPRPRTLLISLDAVPFRVIDELTADPPGDRTLFRDFKGPVPLISTFPSSTSVALVGLLQPLGLEKSPGYEARFFDWQKRKARGGGPFSYAKIEFPWREFFDWSRRSPAGSALEAVRPVKSGTKRLRKAIREFADSDVEVSLIYIAATDTAVHVVGPDSVKELFIALDAMLEEARAGRPDRPFETIVFSDHGVTGGPPLINVSKATKKALRQAGFDVSKKKMKKPNSVVMTPFGLVSNFEAYVAGEERDVVAAVLAEVEGVDLCVFQIAGDRWGVVGPKGSATLSRRIRETEVQWSYEVVGVDPLDYDTVLAALGGGDAESSATDSWVDDGFLFEASTSHRFPDAFQRLADAFELVSNPASVVCSLGKDYMYGAASTAALATIGKGKLRWTHGSLERGAALGFLMSDAEGWSPPEAARYQDALVPFRRDLARHPNVSSGGGEPGWR